MELLTIVQHRVFGTVAPGKIVELFKLGENETNQSGIATATVLAGFYEFLGFPRLLSSDAVRKAIARGVEVGLFGFVTGRPLLGDDGRFQIDRSRIAFERRVADDEIDLDSGFLIVPTALPEEPPTPDDPPPDKPSEDDTKGRLDGGEADDFRAVPTQPDTADGHEIAFSFTANQTNLYEAWSAFANLADVTGEVLISARATCPVDYDKAKLENGVLEPLRELGLIYDEKG